MLRPLAHCHIAPSHRFQLMLRLALPHVQPFHIMAYTFPADLAKVCRASWPIAPLCPFIAFL